MTQTTVASDTHTYTHMSTHTMYSYKVEYLYTSFCCQRVDVTPKLTKFIEEFLQEEKKRKILEIEQGIQDYLNSIITVQWCYWSFIDVWKVFKCKNYFAVHLFIPKKLNIFLRAVCSEPSSLVSLGTIAVAEAVKGEMKRKEIKMKEEKIMSELKLELPLTLAKEVVKCIQMRGEYRYGNYQDQDHLELNDYIKLCQILQNEINW